MSRLSPPPPAAPLAGSTATRAGSPGLRRLVLLAALSAAVGLGLGLTARGGGDPDLVPLLGFMAATKAGIALGAALLVDWRLRHPAGRVLAVLLVGGAALALAGPVVMFDTSQLRLGGLMHYAGLGMLALLAWRDRVAVGAILAAAVEARRRG
jgi:hypothetical protein